MRYIRTLLALVLFAAPALAADHYVRAGASGTGTGADWTNACTNFTGSCAPSSLVRGDTYYVAGGVYNTQVTFNEPDSGTTTITIKAATLADHGGAGDWDAAYAVENGQARITATSANTNWNFTTNYWIVDGQIGDRSGDPTDYGFSFEGPASCTQDRKLIILGTSSSGAIHDYTFKHIAFTNNCPEDHSFSGIGNHSQVNQLYNVTAEYNYFNNLHNAIASSNDTAAVNNNYTIRYNYYDHLDTAGSNHAEWINVAASTANGTVKFQDLIVAYNVFEHTTSTGGVIALNSVIDRGAVYSNLFMFSTSGGNGVIGAGTNNWWANSTFVNNTIANAAGPAIKICVTFCASATGNTVENNLFFAVTNPTVITCGTGCTKDYNAFFQVSTPPVEANGQISSSDPFTDSAGGDYNLAANTNAGLTLMSPYTTDIDGVTFGSGGEGWSRGAYQYVNPDPDPPVPGNSGTITPSAVTSTTMTLTWTKATDAVTPQASLTYQVYRSLSNNMTTCANAVLNGTIIQPYIADIATFSPSGLTPSTTYFFQVAVQDVAGNCAPYTTVSQATAAGSVGTGGIGRGGLRH